MFLSISFNSSKASMQTRSFYLKSTTTVPQRARPTDLSIASEQDSTFLKANQVLSLGIAASPHDRSFASQSQVSRNTHASQLIISPTQLLDCDSPSQRFYHRHNRLNFSMTPRRLSTFASQRLQKLNTLAPDSRFYLLRPPRCIFDRDSNSFKACQRVLLCLAFCMSFFIPLASFIAPALYFSLPCLATLATLQLAFLFDMVIKARTRYINEDGDTVLLPRQLAARYIKSLGFWMDGLLLLPLHLIHFWEPSICLFFTGLKGLRLFRFKPVLDSLMTQTTLERSSKFILLLLSTIYLLYIMSLAWLLATEISYWEAPRLQFYTISETRAEKALDSLYYSVIMIWANEVQPLNEFQDFTASAIMLFGVFLQAQLGGTILWLITQKETQREKVRNHIDAVHSIMRSIEVPADIMKMVTRYMDRTEATRQNQDLLNSLLEQLSPTLRAQVLSQIFLSMLKKHPTFRASCSDHTAQRELLAAFIKEIHVGLVNPEEQIIRFQSEPTEFFLLQRGQCLVETRSFRSQLFKDSKTHHILAANSYFGEVGLLLNCPTTATVSAINYCQLGIVTKRAFLSIVQKFPHLRIQMVAKLMGYPDTLTRKVREALKSLPLFSNLHDQEIQELSYKFEAKKYQPGQIVSAYNKPVDRFILVLRGYAIASLVLPSGEYLPMDILTPLECLNYEGIWVEEARAKVSVYAYESLVTAQISREQLHEFLKKYGNTLFSQQIARLVHSVQLSEIRPYAIDVERRARRSQRSRLARVGGFLSCRDALFKVKSAVAHLVVADRWFRMENEEKASYSRTVTAVQKKSGGMRLDGHAESRMNVLRPRVSRLMSSRRQENELGAFINNYSAQRSQVEAAMESALANSGRLTAVCQFLDEHLATHGVASLQLAEASSQLLDVEREAEASDDWLGFEKEMLRRNLSICSSEFTECAWAEEQTPQPQPLKKLQTSHFRGHGQGETRLRAQRTLA